MAFGKIKKKLLLLLLALFVGVGFAMGLYFSGRHLFSLAGKSVKGFTKEDINRSFGEYVTAIKGSGSGNLEVATYEAMAIFSETNEKSYVWGTIPGGITSVEIKAPVTYRYHVRLDDPWKIDIKDTFCVVHAPAIRPSQPPAIHTDRMEKRIDQSWIRFDGWKMMEDMERKITPELSRRAQANIPLVRENSRMVVATFIKNWLLQDKKWHDHFHAVVVVFPGEKEEDREKASNIVVRETEIHDGSAAGK